MNKRLQRFIISGIMMAVCLIPIIASATPSNTTTKAERDAIAWTWTYSSRGELEQNCLGFALGQMDWVWPWGVENPTLQYANMYLVAKGYTQGSGTMSQDMFVYGADDNVTHFSKGNKGPVIYPCTAKWGKCEIFDHSSADPYNAVPYGPKIASYVKRQ